MTFAKFYFSLQKIFLHINSNVICKEIFLKYSYFYHNQYPYSCWQYSWDFHALIVPGCWTSDESICISTIHESSEWWTIRNGQAWCARWKSPLGSCLSCLCILLLICWRQLLMCLKRIKICYLVSSAVCVNYY